MARRTYEATATMRMDRAGWDALRAAIAPVRAQPLAELHAEGRCAILLRVTGEGSEGAIEAEEPRCTYGAETCARPPACKRCGVRIDADAIQRRAELGRELGLPMPAPTICGDCAIAAFDRESRGDA